MEAELIATLLGILGDLGLKGLSVNINSIGCPHCRPKYHAALKEYLSGRLDQLCPTCRERFDRNPLRVLDCKEEGCKALVKDAPSMLDMLCDECREHFETLQTLLTARGIPFKVDTHIVRGLDYYTKTVFEVMVSRGREGLALCGGGRYDGLVEQLGGPATPAAGFASAPSASSWSWKTRASPCPSPRCAMCISPTWARKPSSPRIFCASSCAIWACARRRICADAA